MEITSRFVKLVRYTTLCPPDLNPLRINAEKDTEAKLLLEKFHFQPNTDGTSFLDPACQLERKQGVLNGGYLGDVVALDFSNKAELLYLYDQKLQALLLPHFSTPPSCKTRSDWCILSCNSHR